MNGCPGSRPSSSAQSEHDPDALAHLRQLPRLRRTQVEEHRRLEKDLFRLVDPLLLRTSCPRVMARVAAASQPHVRDGAEDRREHRRPGPDGGGVLSFVAQPRQHRAAACAPRPAWWPGAT